MGKYARGKRSLALSDRGGLRVKYTDLKTTWDGLRVSPEDWEPKHPQLTPAKNVVDATALFNPRPDNDPENVTFFVGYNYDIFTPIQQRPPVGVPGKGSIGAIPRSSLEYEITVTGVAGTGAVNDVATGTSTDGLAATGALGDYTPESETDPTEVTGVAGDGDTGTAVPNIVIDVTITNGLAGTGALGDFDTGTRVTGFNTGGIGEVGASTLEQEAKPTGVAGTGAVQALGNDSPIALIEETGVAGTGAVHVIGESGNSEFRVNVTGVAGLAAVGNTGEETAVSEIIETGLAGTGAVGDGNAEQVAVGFGNDSWGNGTWGYGT
jgi:hypothetical protein